MPAIGGCAYDSAQFNFPTLPPKEVAVAGYPGFPDFNSSYCEHVAFNRCVGNVVRRGGAEKSRDSPRAAAVGARPASVAFVLPRIV